MKENIESVCTVIITIGMIIIILKLLNIRLSNLFTYRKTRQLLAKCLEQISDLQDQSDVYETQIDVLFSSLKRAKKKTKRLTIRQNSLNAKLNAQGQALEEFVNSDSKNPMIQLLGEVKDILGKGIEAQSNKNKS